MRALVLAAGFGVRLRPLTNDRPKALVEIQGHTLLEIALLRLRSAGLRDVIVNVHHFGEMVIEFLRAHDNFGMHVQISREEVLLDTGGALKKAAHFFQERVADTDEPFILHNVDVLSTIDFGKMVRFHIESGALATLAVQERETSRYLLFDGHARLCGRRSGRDGTPEIVRASDSLQALAFTGIHIISPRILSMLGDQDVFPIIAAYLRLAGQGEKILAFRADEYYWRDLGRPESVAQASHDIAEGKYSIG
jgi:NDP-sugar pyrophosphorylase family protein